MKRILLLLGMVVCLMAARVVFGQTEGVITYEVRINLHRNLPEERQEMKKMVPEFRISHDQLFFNTNESLYKTVEEEEEGNDFDNGGFRIRMQRPQNEVYVDQAASRSVRLQEFMGRRYRIEDSLKLLPWKLGVESKEVHGYPCKQASYYNEERKQTVVAWYTDKLRPFLGPENFNTLPGAVLEVNINDGERIISAIKIEMRSLKKKEIKVPAGGTETTPREFREMMNEQMKRRRANGANIMIRN